jgi:desulfoferrodoxin-like iron-binding protein
MTGRLQIYKCEICGNIVEVLHEGKGELVCLRKRNTSQSLTGPLLASR